MVSDRRRRRFVISAWTVEPWLPRSICVGVSPCAVVRSRYVHHVALLLTLLEISGRYGYDVVEAGSAGIRICAIKIFKI